MSNLPPTPDFATIEASAPASSGQRNTIMAMIGNLVFSWSNNESMFIYVLMLLLGTDEKSAAIVFVTLNTTRARLDLIRRLAKARVRDAGIMQELDKLIERFNAYTRVRNEFNHCTFTMNEEGEITHTHALRIVERRQSLRIGTVREMGRERIDEIVDVIDKLKHFNRDIWAFLPRLEAHLAKSPA